MVREIFKKKPGIPTTAAEQASASQGSGSVFLNPCGESFVAAVELVTSPQRRLASARATLQHPGMLRWPPAFVCTPLHGHCTDLNQTPRALHFRPQKIYAQKTETIFSSIHTPKTHRLTRLGEQTHLSPMFVSDYNASTEVTDLENNHHLFILALHTITARCA